MRIICILPSEIKYVLYVRSHYEQTRCCLAYSWVKCPDLPTTNVILRLSVTDTVGLIKTNIAY